MENLINIKSIDYRMGTIQSVFNQEKICKLFGTTKKKFVYFSLIDQTDCISKKLISKRYYVVIKCSDVGV